MKIRTALLSAAALTVAVAAAQATGGLPKLPAKATYRVCFNQSEMDNPWRLAQTASMQDEAKKLGWTLIFTNANGSAAKQVSDVRSCIAQKVDAIFLTPREEKPLTPVVLEAKKAGHPDVHHRPQRRRQRGESRQRLRDLHRLGLLRRGQARPPSGWSRRRAARARSSNCSARPAAAPPSTGKRDLRTTSPSTPAFRSSPPRPATFTRDEGRKVMETLIQAHPEATAVYAHNDEMALGAITALEAAGRKPGKDITLVSIDGQKSALQAIIDGKLGATVECNPRFGVKAFQTMKDYAAGKPIAARLINQDRFLRFGECQGDAELRVLRSKISSGRGDGASGFRCPAPVLTSLSRLDFS